MQHSTHIQTTEAAIIHHFRNAGDDLSAETEVLDAAIRTIVIEGRKVTTKSLILCLIAEIENETDVVHLDVLRNTLEIVLGRTPDKERS